ncbi:fluoride efflux transporter FluC [Yinghuangia sp. YIM S09857]|uniref:fluoride efflux transporter FluC n=1 Tax=Yinghuangia sp. YIM S09857 TaxID=3436929 RepID=UPI003F534142
MPVNGADEVVDPDVDFRPAPPPPLGDWRVLAVVSAGGVLGASARYGAALLWPTPTDAFPWTIFGVNALGCALMGVFMVLATEARTAHRLVRPFVGTGILGGFTTFSTYAVDIQRLSDHGRLGVGMAYLAAMVVCALACVWGATAVTRRVAGVRPGQGPGERPGPRAGAPGREASS